MSVRRDGVERTCRCARWCIAALLAAGSLACGAGAVAPASGPGAADDGSAADGNAPEDDRNTARARDALADRSDALRADAAARSAADAEAPGDAERLDSLDGSERRGADAQRDADRFDAGASDGIARPEPPDASATAGEPIHFYGRWNRLAGRAITVNGGSHLSASFVGTGATARFDVALNQLPNPTLAWRIDQGDWQEGELAPTIVLSAGLPAGAHDLSLVVRGLNEQQSRWSPPLISSITVLGIDVTGGALVPTPRPLRPRLEFFGDSITEGVALWPNRPGKDTACWRADGRLGYASQTAQALSAEWRQVGFGGQGLLRGGNGGVPVTRESFAWIYAGVARDDWQPDIAILNVGTVDRTDVGPDFGPALTAYVTTVRAGYPRAKIIALRPFGGYHAAEVRAEVVARQAAGDQRIYYVDTTGWLSAADYTDGIHPNAQGSASAARLLATEIRRIGLP